MAVTIDQASDLTIDQADRDRPRVRLGFLAGFRVAGHDDEDGEFTQPVQVTCRTCGEGSGMFGDFGEGADRADLARLVLWAKDHYCKPLACREGTFADIDQNIAANLRTHREADGISQDGLAQQMADRGFGFSQATIWKIESGQRPVKASELVALADALEVRAWDLTAAASLTAGPAADGDSPGQPLTETARVHAQLAEADR
jgi:transcriptional regulator with XRE-family HTH domain